MRPKISYILKRAPPWKILDPPLASLESRLAFSDIGFSLECPIYRLYVKLKLGNKNLYYYKIRICEWV